MTSQKNKYKTTLRYRIFEVSQDGLLKIPKKHSYGYDENTFVDYDSLEEANRAIKINGESGEFIVLPVSLCSINFDAGEGRK